MFSAVNTKATSFGIVGANAKKRHKTQNQERPKRDTIEERENHEREMEKKKQEEIKETHTEVHTYTIRTYGTNQPSDATKKNRQADKTEQTRIKKTPTSLPQHPYS